MNQQEQFEAWIGGDPFFEDITRVDPNHHKANGAYDGIFSKCSRCRKQAAVLGCCKFMGQMDKVFEDSICDCCDRCRSVCEIETAI